MTGGVHSTLHAPVRSRIRYSQSYATFTEITWIGAMGLSLGSHRDLEIFVMTSVPFIICTRTFGQLRWQCDIVVERPEARDMMEQA